MEVQVRCRGIEADDVSFREFVEVGGTQVHVQVVVSGADGSPAASAASRPPSTWHSLLRTSAMSDG